MDVVTDIRAVPKLESVELWYYRQPGKANPKVSLYGTSDQSQLDAVSAGQNLSRLR